LWQDAGQDFLQRLKHLIDGQGPVVGLHIQQHRAEGNRVSGLGPVEHLAGEPRLEEKVLGRPFQIRPLAFFQVNPDVLEKIILLLRERLPALSRPGQTDDPVPTLLDLYCGGGVLGLGILGDDIRWHLIGIDSTAEGIQDARNNAEKLRPGRATFIEGNVEEMLGEEQLREAQVAVIDPPRAGLRAEALRALAESGPPVLFYVACSTAALARDSRALMASGYVPEFLCPADMMPQTPYVEWIAGFRRP
jgi:23S rRNA (uracil1939-C5)-methyltransferase